jgi:hypothetical protein
VLIDDVAEESDLGTPQFTLGLLGVKLVLPKACKYLPQQPLVLICGFGIYQNIVEENDHAPVQQIVKDFVH